MQRTLAIDPVETVNETVWSPTTPLPYMPQLDALRTFAAFSVMVSHYIPSTDQYADFGALGVKLFFVLSGFLITSILLRSKVLIERDGQSLALTFRQFYVRRALRLFPLFYLVLFIITVLGVPKLQATWGWHAAYLSNVHFFMQRDFDASVSHFWSLSVEEQFYLIWPLLLLLVPRSRLQRLIWMVVLVGPIFRVACTLLLTNSQLVSVLPLSCFDKLGAGALLAVWSDPSFRKKEYVVRLRKVGLYIGLPLIVFTYALQYLQTALLFRVAFSDIFITIVCMWVISRASIGFEGKIGRLLEWRPLVYIGTISYGVYLFHNFMPLIVPPALRRIGLPADSLALNFVLMSLATVGIASVSWHFFERPVNALKKHFAYKVSQ